MQPNTISISVNPVGYYFSNVKKDTRIYGVRLVEGSEATRIILRDQNNQLLATGTTRKGDILYFNKPVVMYADNSD
ncbi:MAG: hypothetical protein LBG59_07985 [Candidatus Peribacteria bacterium]|nr:hypothetical protein [Candidatus Peribacteria bacterium]